MIVIKIKTWKDWKKDFIEWVQAPRRKTCKEYVNYMEAISQKVVEKRLQEELDKLDSLNDEQKDKIIIIAQQGIADCREGTNKLIDETEPKKFL